MCKDPLSEPALVTEVNHNRLQFRFNYVTRREVHPERLLQVPKGYDPEHSNVGESAGPGEEEPTWSRPALKRSGG